MTRRDGLLSLFMSCCISGLLVCGSSFIRSDTRASQGGLLLSLSIRDLSQASVIRQTSLNMRRVRRMIRQRSRAANRRAGVVGRLHLCRRSCIRCILPSTYLLPPGSVAIVSLADFFFCRCFASDYRAAVIGLMLVCIATSHLLATLPLRTFQRPCSLR
jgi:hypothetical protein